MRNLLIVTAALAVAACANRAEDEVGAAPDQGDTTAVTQVVDTTRLGPPGTGGRPGDATITLDSIAGDSAQVGSGDATQDSSLVGQDNSAPGGTGTGADSTVWEDSTQAQ